MKTIIVVDGQNLYYQLQAFRLLERDIHWSNFFNSLIEKKDNLIRTYWFRAERLYAGRVDISTISKNLSFEKYRKGYQDLKEKEQREVKEEAESRLAWFREKEQKFNSIQNIYKQLSQKYENIELVLVGFVKAKLKDKTFAGEKGVDLALASKIVQLSLQKHAEKIILISGDYDYAYAINLIKDNMTKVHIVKLFKGHPPKNRSI